MESELTRFVRALPKVELHLHLEGSVGPELALRLARRRGIDLPGAAGGIEGVRASYRFGSFAEFIALYLAISRCLQEVEDVAEAVEDLGRRLTAQNVRYAEVTFTPMTHVARGVDPNVLLEGLAAGRMLARSDHRVELRWVFDVVRTLPAQAMPTLELARAMEGIDPGAVVGLGLGGLESEAEDHPQIEDAFARAKAEGLRSLPHAGELAGPASIWRAIDRLGADRIGHGVRCLADAALMETLRERGIALEVCPTSNVVLGVVPHLRDHPLPQLMARGIPLSLGSDDPPLFGTDLVLEYARCARAFGWGAQVIRSLAASAVDHAFAPAPLAADIRSEQDRVPDPSGPLDDAEKQK